MLEMLTDRDYLRHRVQVSFSGTAFACQAKPTYTLSPFTQSTLRHQAVLMVQFGKEASQTRDYFVAGTRRFARLAQILRCAKNACFRMTIKLHHYPAGAGA